mmetsp:Transcript_13826/g.15262  ORF Transcript_13826/g.15262 Transcript_13826/m.15262 type:complete len:191 (+) Transcript_13826:125-697(+)|eukprot:CAMPEP_0168528900 /NCGR_PEP_ID=MMETSP0405-20121227/13550_1 /TAXON_ID=498012 /ORGANISM="Trichosphaerium sp, Strain Am-I-7 wt" /LENGTH=190 /DNA_ID=CAMNT_0008552445 /DNA_START=103 /DNA_END=675 /DNA_ORIENTATION=-
MGGMCCSESGSGSSDQSNHDHHQQFFLVGHPGVGKTSMLVKFTDNQFPADGIDVSASKTKIIEVADRQKVKITLHDTAGQEKFRTITSSFYGNSEGVVIVYDITSQESYEQLELWFTEVKRYAKQGVQLILVGNKADLEGDRVITREQAEALANKEEVSYIETSAATGKHLDELFTTMAEMIIEAAKPAI